MIRVSKIHCLYIVFAAAVLADKRQVEDVNHAPIIGPSSTISPNTLNTEAIQKQQDVTNSLSNLFDWGAVQRILKETSSVICFFCPMTVNIHTPAITEKNMEVASTIKTTTKDIDQRVEDTSSSTEDIRDSCQCVPYYLCERSSDRENGRQCQGDKEVCCIKLLEPVLETETVTEPVKPLTCGFSNPQGLGILTRNEKKDVSETLFGEFPWVVAILELSWEESINKSIKVYGGVGTLIHPQVVMTGAHIANKYADSKMKIRAGDWDTQTLNEIFPYQERDVAEVIIHRDYQLRNLINCVALLRLSKPLELTNAPNINVLCLPEQDEKFDNHKNCVANGWGKNGFGKDSRYSVIMKKVMLDMVDHTRCNMLLGRTRLEKFFKLHSSFVCAGGEEGKDTCQGDGGAPLACPVGNDQYKLVGMVAWSIGCGVQDVPAVYTNVAAFRTWTDEKMAEWGSKLNRISRQHQPRGVHC